MVEENEKYTDEQGVCTITGVAPGTYTLNISKEGFVTAEEQVTVTNKNETVNITLTEEEIVEEPLGSVKFTIQDSSEENVAGATITLTNTVTNAEYSNGNGGTGVNGGNSTINNLPYGTYSVSVTCTGYEDATDEITIDSEDQITKVITLTQA